MLKRSVKRGSDFRALRLKPVAHEYKVPMRIFPVNSRARCTVECESPWRDVDVACSQSVAHMSSDDSYGSNQDKYA